VLGVRMRPMSFDEVRAGYRKNIINCPDPEAAERMIAEVLRIKEQGDTAGGVVEVVARGVPAGLGEPVFDKLRATIAHGLASIGAVAGVEFGDGFRAGTMKGSEWNDPPCVENGRVRFRTNHCGGFLGGMSNGEDLVMRIAVKPTPTLSLEQDTVHMPTLEERKLAAITRRDPTICGRIYPVAEAMVAAALADALMIARGYDAVCRIENPWRQI